MELNTKFHIQSMAFFILQGSWMCMFLTVIVSMYMFTYVYNLLLLIAHPQHLRWQITSAMGVTNARL